MVLRLFDIFYLSLSIAAFIAALTVLFILTTSYRRFAITTLLIYSLSMLMFSIHNLTHALLFVYRPKIHLIDRTLSVLDTVHTIAAFLGVLFLYIATEFSARKELPSRALLVFFIAGGALASEFLGKDPLAEPLSLVLEAVGLVVIVLIVLSTHLPLLKYAEDREPRLMVKTFLAGIILLATSPITNVSLSYLNAPSIIIDLWEIQFITGVLVLTYVLYKKPYMIMEAYSRPKLFAVIDIEGKTLYRIQLDRRLSRIDIEATEEFLKVIPLLSRELMKTKASPRELKFSDFEVAVTESGEVASLLIAEKTSKTTMKILEEITKRFCQDIYPILKKEKPTEGEIEKLKQFDLEIKGVVTETTY